MGPVRASVKSNSHTEISAAPVGNRQLQCALIINNYIKIMHNFRVYEYGCSYEYKTVEL